MTMLDFHLARKMFTAFACAAATTFGLSAAIAAPTIVPTYNSMDAETLSKIISAQGQLQITPDLADAGGPILKVQMAGGIVYSVLMDDCDHGQPNLCKSLEFRAVLPPGTLNFAQINAFNENMRYATAYLSDKGVPQLRMDANLRGGVTADFVSFDVQIFTKLVLNYVQQAK